MMHMANRFHIMTVILILLAYMYFSIEMIEKYNVALCVFVERIVTSHFLPL